MTSSRRAPFTLLCLLAMALAFGSVASTDAAPKGATKKDVAADKKKDKDKKEAPTWNVDAPPGEWKEVSIDTKETTWSTVDVSPD